MEGSVNLLFLAKEWTRKGGDVVLETFQSLLSRGINANLTLLGTKPQNGFTHPKMTVVSYLDKNQPEDQNRFISILKASHLLMLSSRAECYGIVLCEANAFLAFRCLHRRREVSLPHCK